MRALTRTMGTPRRRVMRNRLGQNSDSIHSVRSGRQWSRNRCTAYGRSTGTNWWKARCGSRSANSLAEVTVPVVTST